MEIIKEETINFYYIQSTKTFVHKRFLCKGVENDIKTFAATKELKKISFDICWK